MSQRYIEEIFRSIYLFYLYHTTNLYAGWLITERFYLCICVICAYFAQYNHPTGITYPNLLFIAMTYLFQNQNHSCTTD